MLKLQINDYLLPIKGNQKTLYEDLKMYIDTEKNKADFYETYEEGHGRKERRKVYSFKDAGWIKNLHPKWHTIKSFCLLESYRKEANKNASNTFRIYIASKIMSSMEFLTEIRAHWHIENKLHWPLNQSFSESKTLIKNFKAIINVSIIQGFAISLLSKVK